MDVAVQLVLALQRLATTSGSGTTVAAIRNPELLEACIALGALGAATLREHCELPSQQQHHQQQWGRAF